MNQITEASNRLRRRSVGRILLLIAALVFALYFVLTSEAFVKGVILPRVGAALDADVTVAGASIRPFSGVSLRDLEVRPRGGDPVFTAREIRVRYSAWSMLVGKVLVTEAVFESPVVAITENADGTTTLDALLGTRTAAEEPAAPATARFFPREVGVELMAVNNATLRLEKVHEGGARDVTEVTGLDFSAHDIEKGSSGTIALAAALAREQAAQADAPAGSFQATLAGSFTLDLLADLRPASVKGSTALTVERAGGAFADLRALAVTLDCEITPTEFKRVALGFTKAGTGLGRVLGEVRVSGPFSLAKMEGKLKAEVVALDREVLNLAVAGSGMDFGSTTISSSTDIEVTQGGQEISLGGHFDVDHFQVTHLEETSPTLDLRGDFDVRLDSAGKSASLEVLDLVGTQEQSPLLRVSLDKPLTVAWGETSSATGDATLHLAVTRLNLADWRAFAGAAAPAGTVDAKLKVASTSGGKRLALELDSRVEQFSATFGDDRFRQVDAQLQAHASAVEMKQFALADSRLEIGNRGQPAVVMSGSGTFDSATEAADLQVAVRATLARVLALLPQPEANITAGALDFTGRVSRKPNLNTVTAELALTNFTGRYGDFRFKDYGGALEIDAGMQGDLIEIRSAAGDLREGRNAGGHFDASGNYETAKKSGQVAVKLTDFNPNGLRPFIESALGGKQLVSIALNTSATASLAANGDAAIETDLEITNLVVEDPAGALPATPLGARVQLDATVINRLTEIREGKLTLTPTDRAKNELTLTGKLDASTSDVIGGNLELVAESLDVTRYYDLFAGSPKPAPEVVPPPAGPEPEPPAMDLPFQDFAFVLSIDRFYLRELAITKLRSTTRIDAGRVVLNPLSLTLDGAPITATMDLDLGVQGYKYDLTFDGDQIPLTPLVNSFMPERKDRVHGVTLANAQIKGAGVTGPSLRKNLSGELGFASTNLDLAITDVKSPLLNGVVSVVTTIPALLRNPTAAFGDLLAKFSGAGARGGFTEELTSQPIDSMLMRGRVAAGRFTVERAEAKSAAFEVATAGDITLADDLAKSVIRLPVRVSLSRPLALKVGLAGNTPTTQAMVVLPDFLTMKGPIGDPKSHVDKLAVVALAAQAGGGGAGQIGGAAGGAANSILDAVGGLLGGKKKADSSSDPAPGAAPAPAPNLIDLFKKPKKSKP